VNHYIAPHHYTQIHFIAPMVAMMPSSNAMWGVQNILHQKNSPVVPGMLMLISGSLIVHRHMTQENEDGDDHLKTFLGMILIQMIPLVILELKVISCADPVGLFCKFSGPVVLMHGVFLAFRLCMYPIHEHGYIGFTVAGFLGVLVTLYNFYQRWSPRAMFGHSAVWKLTAMAFLAACCTTWADDYLNPSVWRQQHTWFSYFVHVLESMNSYVELLAFVPAVWMIYNDKSTQFFEVDSVDCKRRAAAFFVFLVCFYFLEDVYQAYEALGVMNVAAVAHIVHYLLLVDFAFYVLAHVYNPDKLVGELRKWLPADMRSEV